MRSCATPSADWLRLRTRRCPVWRPASQRPHVRAIEYDQYHVGRGNAQLMSQGDFRTGQVTRFAEGSRGLFPLRLSLELRAAAAGGRCRRHAISAAAPLAGRRETGPGMAFAARRPASPCVFLWHQKPFLSTRKEMGFASRSLSFPYGQQSCSFFAQTDTGRVFTLPVSFYVFISARRFPSRAFPPARRSAPRAAGSGRRCASSRARTRGSAVRRRGTWSKSARCA